MEEKNVKKLVKKYKFLKKKTLPNGVECGIGWDTIVNNLCKELNDANLPEDFIITKIFTKMDELKLHTKGGNNSTRFIIDAASEKSADVCESCGNGKELHMCDKCKEPDPYIENDIAAIITADNALGAPAASCSGCANGPSCSGTPAPSTPSVPTAPSPVPIAISMNPPDYYFKMMVNQPIIGGGPTMDYFIIVPKIHWDANKNIYNNCLPIDTLLENNGFDYLMDGVYEYSKGQVQSGKTDLLALGFVENNNM